MIERSIRPTPSVVRPSFASDSVHLPPLPRGFHISDNHLFYKGLDVYALALPDSPVYVRHLPSLRANVSQLQTWFRAAAQRVGYSGTLTIAFASKANPSEPVVRTLLQAGTAYECSSAYDVQVVRQALAKGWIDGTRSIFINGFKLPCYTQAVIALRAEGHAPIIPIFDDLDEIEPFAASGLPFDVGVRFRTDPHGGELNRFGMTDEELAEAADRIALSDTLRLTTFHAMQAIPASRGGMGYWLAVANSVRAYARLRRISPALTRFDIGGGMPARSAEVDPGQWVARLLQTIQTVCAQESVPVPDLIIESGRFLTQDHAFRLFHVLKRKSAADGVPYFLIDSSLMSTLPDAWALGDSFTVLPINGWEGAFGPARLAGLTCDHDDVYPTHRMNADSLCLPYATENLLIGVFDCGAYQETLGGRGGAKHCMLPEAPELILDETADGTVEMLALRPGQNAACVLGSLGYS